MKTSCFLLFLLLFQLGNKSFSQCSVKIPEYDTIPIGESVTLIASAFGGTPPYTYLWNDSSYSQTITVSPTVTTSYSVTITDANACTASDTVIVEVFPPLSISLNTPDDTLCPLECTNIFVAVSGGMGCPYTLKLNDGTVVSSPFTVCPGVTKTYIVTATDNCTLPPVSDSITIYVIPYPPVNIFADKLNGCVPLTVNFAETSPDEGMTYLWDFGDPFGDNSSTEKNPEHTFNNPGLYDITCTVTSVTGCKNSLKLIGMIHVLEANLTDFSFKPDPPTTLDEVQFTNLSKSVSTCQWDFGDGVTSSEQNPVHQFIKAGLYDVKLTCECLCCLENHYKIHKVNVEYSGIKDVILENKVYVISKPDENLAEIHFGFEKVMNIQIVLSDILGNHLSVIPQSRYEAGKQIVSIDISKCSKGIYIISLISDNLRMDKKFVKIK